ncbi:tagaturonate reductase [Lacrimispora saccharolytica]|uniref:Mannitol dehydrogenase domain protein n=1 Tax=Lacrimispora saccharolytica (strain ATCC 35040 / DSM 2544 / NRCC 2533 / WM1) TaxID=610130 RepID=D9R7H9_LACSW|nr:tagaturonate reductase [Lacrimispora saccharolytica]ADL03708.1 Mannitol dehydrogenase domain protein [[Clostridium] saccharolyticum WM1]QRV18159.1 tagaturonate reductase [Lacrimispora saccharolytica]
MEKLCYATLEKLGFDGYLLQDAPERVMQFGEGNFLRAFVDYFIDVLNEKTGFNSKVVLCQPIAPGLADMINEQEGLYTLFLRGFENGKKVNDKRVISCVSRCLNPYTDYEAVLACAENPDLRYIACNTTEAGITYDPSCQFADVPAGSYPGKLTQFLYRRFETFGKEAGKGFVILSCELIDNNGKELEKCVLNYARQWDLGGEFIDWIKEENLFCSTLVDRIVTGYPRNEAAAICEELGYQDNIIDTGEIFGFWVIEGPESLKKELLFEEAGLPVIICSDHKPYKQRKVRILNGAHTSFVLGAYLSGQDIVRNCMDDEVICSFMNKTIYDEIIPTLTLPKEELMSFAASVAERFKNPFIDHALLSISLNSTSKWKARVMPSLKAYVEKTGALPKCITASFAFYLAFYHGRNLTEDGLVAARPAGDEYTVKDDKPVLQFFYDHKDDDTASFVHAVCTNDDFWDEDLSKIPGFEEAVAGYLRAIKEKGTYEVMKECSH